MALQNISRYFVSNNPGLIHKNGFEINILNQWVMHVCR